MKLYEKYLLKDLLKVFFVFLFCFFFLYVVMDYSVHAHQFLKSSHIRPLDVFLYYAFSFLKRLELLLPLALLIATIKVLTTLNKNFELLALESSGISMQKIVRPTFYLALFCTGAIWLNFQFALPISMNFIDDFQTKNFKNGDHTTLSKVHAIPLQDGTKVIYRSYNVEKRQLEDVFYLISLDHIYHMKTLLLAPQKNQITPLFKDTKIADSFMGAFSSDFLSSSTSAQEKESKTIQRKNTQPATLYPNLGVFVDELKRSETGHLEKIRSYPVHFFPSLKLNDPTGHQRFIPIENRSISSLFSSLKSTPIANPDVKAGIQTWLWYKTLTPFISVLLVFLLIPYCTRFSRTGQPFFLYALAMFGFISFFMLMHAAVILGESQTTPPCISFILLFAIPLAFGVKKYLKEVL